MQEFINCTPKDAPQAVKKWLDQSLAHVPLTGNILEIGSAFGREIDYIETKGYKVIGTDGAQAFVDYLVTHGYQAYKLNIITDELSDRYHFIFANTVFLHFTPAELDTVFAKVYNALVDEGVFSFTLKIGDGQEWTTPENDKLRTPRYFCYWRSPAIELLLKNHNFKVISLIEDGPIMSVIAQKI